MFSRHTCLMLCSVAVKARGHCATQKDADQYIVLGVSHSIANRILDCRLFDQSVVGLQASWHPQYSTGEGYAWLCIRHLVVLYDFCRRAS
jgi:hypothetical protein